MYYPTPCIISIGKTVLNLGHSLQLARIWVSLGKNEVKLREESATTHPTSPQLRTMNKKGNFVCPDSSQTIRLFHHPKIDATHVHCRVTLIERVNWY